MRRLIEPSHLDLCCLQKPIIIACGSERVKGEPPVQTTTDFPYIFYTFSANFKSSNCHNLVLA